MGLGQWPAFAARLRKGTAPPFLQYPGLYKPGKGLPFWARGNISALQNQGPLPNPI